MRDLVRRGPPGPVGDALRGIPGVVDGPFGPSGFDPLADPDLVALWLADDASDDGATLTQPDRGPGGYHLTATGGSGRPSLASGGFVAGHQAINFASLASGWVTLSSSAIGAALTGGQKATVFSLLGPIASPAAGYVMRYGAAAAGDFWWRHSVPSTGQHDMAVVNTTIANRQSILRGEPASLPVIMAWTFDGSLASNKIVGVYRDGDWLMAGTTVTEGAPTTTMGNKTLYVGANSSGASPIKQPWGGGAVVKRVLTQAEIERWVAWFRSQHGMAAPRRILFTGDSITAAATGWRKRVWDLYAAGSYAPGLHQPIGPLGLGATYLQNYHDASSGSRVADCVTRLTTTLASGSAYYPHVVAMLAGVNDIILDAKTAAQVAAAWEAALVSIYDLRPDVKIKLLSLINNSVGSIIDAANALGPTAVANAIASRPAMQAEWVEPWSLPVSLADGTHPDAAGYSAMGDSIYPLVMTW